MCHERITLAALWRRDWEAGAELDRRGTSQEDFVIVQEQVTKPQLTNDEDFIMGPSRPNQQKQVIHIPKSVGVFKTENFVLSDDKDNT